MNFKIIKTFSLICEGHFYPILWDRQRLGVNFTNILHAVFLYKRFAGSFLCLHFRFEHFWCKNIGAKNAPKILVKLTRGEKIDLTHKRLGTNLWLKQMLISFETIADPFCFQPYFHFHSNFGIVVVNAVVVLKIAQSINNSQKVFQTRMRAQKYENFEEV